MNRIQAALSVLIGGVPKITFGLEKATAIFKAATGRFDGDKSKAVPFAIMETARAMGAEITVFEEAKAEKLGIAGDIKMVEAVASNVTRQNRDLIITLEAKKTVAEKTIADTNRHAVGRVASLKKDGEAVDAVVDFFA